MSRVRSSRRRSSTFSERARLSACELRDAQGAVVHSVDLGGNDGELTGIEIRAWNAKGDEAKDGAAKEGPTAAESA